MAGSELLNSTDPEIVKIRDIVSQRAREDMLDFNKLSPAEQRLTRVLFIYPFIRAAVAQPVWMLREYPLRMMAMANVANAQQSAYGEDDPLSMKDKYDAVMPAGERSMFDLNDVPFARRHDQHVPDQPHRAVHREGQRPLDGAQRPEADRAHRCCPDQPRLRRDGARLVRVRGDGLGEGARLDAPRCLLRDGGDVRRKKRGAQKYTDRDSFGTTSAAARRFASGPRTSTPRRSARRARRSAKKPDKRPSWEKSHGGGPGDARQDPRTRPRRRRAPGRARRARPKIKKFDQRLQRARRVRGRAEGRARRSTRLDRAPEDRGHRAGAAGVLPEDGPKCIMDRAAVEELPDKRARQRGARRTATASTCVT